MASAVVCDCCGAVSKHQNAKHVRIYCLSSATTFDPHKLKDNADVCDACWHKLRQMLKLEVVVDAD